MEQKEQKAVESFKSGLNCAQAVLTAYSDDLGFDKSLASMISCGFGGGMGRLQETCGAVTGSFMVLGIHYCKKYTDNKDRKEKTYAAIQSFDRKFKSIYNTTSCKTLLNCDLKTEEGQKFHKEQNQGELICSKCIADAVRIVNELIEK
jgi:C_GCAxxG_C_C family probable redox protein